MQDQNQLSDELRLYLGNIFYFMNFLNPPELEDFILLAQEKKEQESEFEKFLRSKQEPLEEW